MKLYSKIENPTLKQKIKKMIIKCLTREIVDVSRETGLAMNMVFIDRQNLAIQETFTTPSVSLQNMVRANAMKDSCEDEDTDETENNTAVSGVRNQIPNGGVFQSIDLSGAMMVYPSRSQRREMTTAPAARLSRPPRCLKKLNVGSKRIRKE